MIRKYNAILIALILLGGSLFAEVQKRNYSSGELKTETNIQNGKREGMTKGYYKDGTLKYETNFTNDKREGIAKGYYKNGKLKSEKIYKNGTLEGISKEYYKSGKLKSEWKFESDIPVSGTKYTEDGQKVTN